MEMNEEMSVSPKCPPMSSVRSRRVAMECFVRS